MRSAAARARPRGWDEWLAKASDKQKAFLDSTVKDVAYGGARGGGKSIALLLDFASYAGTFGKLARGGIFRRTYTELEELILKGQMYFVDQLGWDCNKTAHLFTCVDRSDPAYGATLRMAYLKNNDDARIYAGWELPWMGFDELGNWADPEPLDILMGSMRSAPGQPTYRRSSCMPGGPGHVWVRERYRPEEPGVIRQYKPLPDTHPEITVETLFIPALLEDNPNVDQADYESNLALIGNAKLYEAWRRGDWSLVAGAFFDNWDEDLHVLRGALPKADPWNPRWMAGDWGFKDDCVIGWFQMNEHGEVTLVHELKVNRMAPEDVGKLIAKTTVELDLGVQSLFALGPDAWAERTTVKPISELVAEGMAEYLSVEGRDPKLCPYPYRADTDREGGWMLLYQMLGAGLFKAHESCKEVRRSIPALQHDEKNSADVAESPLDHAPDMVRYGLKTYFADQKVPVAERIRRAVAEKLGPVTGAGPAPTDHVETEIETWDRETEGMSEVEKRQRANDIAWATRVAEKKERKVRGMRRRMPYARIG